LRSAPDLAAALARHPRAGRRLAGALGLSLAAAAAAGPATGRGDNPKTPRRTELVEEAESRLAQLDVTVTGPPDVVSSLGRADFKLKVHMRWLDEFEVDRHCAPADGREALAPPDAARPAVIYLFYFDQPFLTLPGRARAMDIARELVAGLVVDGDRAMIVSNAARLSVVEGLTDDRQRLADALDRLENDRTQWDTYASEEDARVARVMDILNGEDNVHRAVGMARSFQREEHARADKSLRRLRIALARLSELDSRKAVVYFADALRQNPGEHYVSFFGNRVKQSTTALSDMSSEAFAAGVAFDKVLNEATAQGIRFYPVYAQGLVTPYDRDTVNSTGLARAGTVPSSSRVRLRDAQRTMASMASETGGHVFLRGEGPVKIIETIVDDYACVYTLSFDPAGFPEDEPLRVIVRALRPGVRLETRGRTVIQSESARLVARLLSAFTVGAANDVDFDLRANLVPTAFERGAYDALLQISVPGTGIPDARWELGASLISRDKVLDEVAGTLSAGRPDVPLVLEREIEIRPGPHEIVAVAHESSLGFVLSEHLQVAWPDPNDRPVTCGPLALLQPTAGAFVRAGDTRIVGSLARSATEPVSADLPTALMGLVCRSRRHQGVLRVERTLIGDTAVEFPSLEFELAAERCAQIRDLIPAGSLRPGPYRYVMQVLHDGAMLHEASRDFIAAALEP
jgi:VWFA-related protein